MLAFPKAEAYPAGDDDEEIDFDPEKSVQRIKQTSTIPIFQHAVNPTNFYMSKTLI